MVRNDVGRKELLLMKRLDDEFMSEMEEEDVGGSTLAMEVDDDAEPFDPFTDPFQSLDSKKLSDRKFFNSFEDDFDDADIN